ncbi:MAG: AAA family ATPase, partial [Rhodospirillales bacterium]|nr:AAA family ATPase [Rhodospirillales bacterium]
MKFTRLKLSGFKSFLETTELHIDPGLTGIVGPNGCGKSNLIEALRWVMGESSARQLRGGEMEDVIFSGSANRPPRNFAEVTIELDNSDGSAPPAYSSCDLVQISRRIQRDRGSLYRVNGREVRARDVQLLFADAASGARSAALVTQGQVAALITAKPTDRRAYLEEAAGITGLYSRRHEAELKLRSTESNLQRVEDVLAALSSQRQNMQRQARQATRYREISQQIRTMEARVLLRRWQEAQSNLSTLTGLKLSASTVIDDLNATIADLDRRRARVSSILPEHRKVEQEAAAATERLRAMGEALAAEIARLETDRASSLRRLEEASGDLAREQATRDETEKTLQRLVAERARLTAASLGEETTRQRAEADLAQTTAELNSLEEQLSSLTRSVANATAQQDSRQQRLAELDSEGQKLRLRLEDVVRRQCEQGRERVEVEDTAEAEKLREDAEAALTASRDALDDADARLAVAVKEAKEAADAYRADDAIRSRLTAEYNALRDLIELEDGGTSGKTVLVDAIDVPQEIETALAAALGDDALLPMEGQAPRHWQTLPTVAGAIELPPGVDALAKRVNAPDALARRLSQVGLVTNRTTGEALHAGLLPGQRLVSTDGAVWRWDGYHKPAERDSPAAVRIRQRARLSEIEASVAEAAAQTIVSEKALERARQKEGSASNAVKERRERVRADEASAKRAQQAAARAAPWTSFSAS